MKFAFKTALTIMFLAGSIAANCSLTAGAQANLSAGAQDQSLKTAANPDILANLKGVHPRLLLDQKRISEIVATAEVNEEFSVEYKALVAKGLGYLKEPPIAYKKADMLMISRRIMRRVINLSFLYRVTNDKRYLQRARTEMLSAAAFPDWNAQHFLETAELMNGLAIGYDWLYNDLSLADRATIRSAIVNKGLLPIKTAYAENKYFWVQDNATNWNQVCNGSAIIACLALGNDDPAAAKLVKEIAPIAFNHFQDGMKNYGPDGAWDEGPGYWHYATSYAVRTIAALTSATGSDFGLAESPGFSQTGDFALAMIAPSGHTFNFADADGIIDTYPEFSWLSKRFNKPYLAWRERDQLTKDRTNINALDILWYNETGKYDDLDQLPTAFYYAGKTQAVSLRSSWNELHSAFIAVKGGNNASHHAHLDLGTFVYEFDGVRWAELLGGDDYNLPGYFNTKSGAQSPRWKYYRLSTAGQNLVVIDNANQDEKAFAPVEKVESGKDKAVNFAIIDLSQAYANLGVTMKRGVALYGKEDRVLVQDQISSSRPVDAVWQIHTRAEIDIAENGKKATLRLGDHQLEVSLVDVDNAKFAVEELSIPAPQQPVQNVRLLKVKFDKPVTNQRIAVLFAPFFEPAARKDKMPKIMALENWASDLEKSTRGDAL